MNPTILKTIVKGLLVPISVWMYTGCFHPHTPPGPQMPSIDPALETSSMGPESEIPSVEPELEISSVGPEIESPPPPAPADAFYIHKVRWAGETVSIISRWYTGSHSNWKSVALANPDINPNQILVGDDILVPVYLLKTDEPMPQRYLTSFPKQESPPSSSLNRLNSAIEADEIELFGPKEREPPAAELEAIELFGPRDIEQLKTEIDEIELFER